MAHVAKTYRRLNSPSGGTRLLAKVMAPRIGSMLGMQHERFGFADLEHQPPRAAWTISYTRGHRASCGGQGSLVLPYCLLVRLCRSHCCLAEQATGVHKAPDLPASALSWAARWGSLALGNRFSALHLTASCSPPAPGSTLGLLLKVA